MHKPDPYQLIRDYEDRYSNLDTEIAKLLKATSTFIVSTDNDNIDQCQDRHFEPIFKKAANGLTTFEINGKKDDLSQRMFRECKEAIQTHMEQAHQNVRDYYEKTDNPLKSILQTDNTLSKKL